MDFNYCDIHIDTFKTLPFDMQRLYADQYNVPEGCTTEDICNRIFPGERGNNKYIPRIAGHVLYSTPVSDGGRPFKDVMDCVDWLLVTRTSELIEPKEWVFELPDSTDASLAQDESAPTGIVDGDRYAFTTFQSLRSPLKLQLDKTTHNEPEDISKASQPTQDEDSFNDSTPSSDICRTVEDLCDRLERAHAQIKKTRLHCREAAADLYELETVIKKEEILCEDIFHSTSKFVKGRVTRRIRREARFAAKYNRLPVEDGDDYYFSDVSDSTASSDDSDQGVDSDGNDEDDDDGNGEPQSYIPNDVPDRPHTPPRRFATPPTVEQRLRESQWSVSRPSEFPPPTRTYGLKRIHENDVPDQNVSNEVEEDQLGQPSPTKKQRLEEKLDEESSSIGSKTSTNINNLKWKDYPSDSSDDSSGSYDEYPSSDKSTGSEDYIMNSDDEVELQMDCENFLDNPAKDSDTGSNGSRDGDFVTYGTNEDDDDASKAYDSDDSRISYFSARSEEKGPPPRKPRSLARSRETLHQDERGNPFTWEWINRDEHEDTIDQKMWRLDWEITQEQVDQRIGEMFDSDFDKYEYDDQAFQNFEEN